MSLLLSFFYHKSNIVQLHKKSIVEFSNNIKENEQNYRLLIGVNKLFKHLDVEVLRDLVFWLENIANITVVMSVIYIIKSNEGLVVCFRFHSPFCQRLYL